MKHSRYRARKRKTRISSATVGAALRGLAFLLIVTIAVAGIRWISDNAKSYSAQWRRSEPSSDVSLSALAAARTRCANQVSVLPQANTSPEEPAIAELDRPDAVASGNEAFPNLSSSLLDADPGIPAGPTASGPGGTSGGFGPPSTFIPLPIGGPGGITPPKTGGGLGCTTGNCTPPPPPPPPPPTVPEPGTLLLVGSGAAALIARLRARR